MQVALVIYGRIETISGGYLYDRQLVTRLRHHGHEVTIISLPWVCYGRSLLYNSSRNLWRQLTQTRFDLILQDELNHPSLFWFNRRLRTAVSTPVIAIVHHLRSSEQHPLWLLPLYRAIERRYLASADGFLVNSQATLQSVTTLLGAVKPHVVAYPAGNRFQPILSADQIQQRTQADGPLQLLFVGNLIPRKGLDMLLTAVTNLPPGAWQLHVVGDTAVAPTYTHRLKQHIRAAGLGQNVTLYGRLDDAAVAEQMQASHLLVVPSQHEGFGIVYMEGMGFGLPAIGTTGSGAAEIITDGVNGFLLDPTDAVGLAQRLQHLHQHRDQLVTMSLAAQQRYQQHATWTESMDTAVAFLTQMAQQGQPAK